MNNFLDKLYKKIENGEASSPFLFIWKNLELLNSKISDIASGLLKKYDVPNISLYTLASDWEKIKIETIKKFLEIWNMDTPYRFQIFLIEDVSRLTLQAANSCLKFFEEPWKKNIVFLTNSWETWVLDTVLSRVQTIDMWWVDIESSDSFFNSMIDSYINPHPNLPHSQEEGIATNTNLISYFFKNKLDKQDYTSFLKTLIVYARDNFVFLEYLEEIESDLNVIKTNNVNPKWVVDKWILKIKI